MGCQHDFAINGKTSAFFGSNAAVLGCDWWRNFFKNRGGFHFSWSGLVFLAK